MTDEFCEDENRDDFLKGQHNGAIALFSLTADLATRICRTGNAADAWDAYRRLWGWRFSRFDSLRDECDGLRYLPAAKLRDATGLLESSAHGAALTFAEQVLCCWSAHNTDPDFYRARAAEFDEIWQREIKPALLALPTINAGAVIEWMKEEIALLTGDTILTTCDRLIEGVYDLCALQNAGACTPLEIEQAHRALQPQILSILQIMEKWGLDSQRNDDPLRQLLHDPAQCPDSHDNSMPSVNVLYLLRMVRAEAIRRDKENEVHLLQSKPEVAAMPAHDGIAAPDAKRELPLKDLSVVVKKLIHDDEKITVARIFAILKSQNIKTSTGSIASTEAWKENMQRRRQPKPPESDRERAIAQLSADQAKDAKSRVFKPQRIERV